MTEEVEDQEKVNGFRIFGMFLPSLPSLMLKFGGVFLRFKREAKKGGRTFQRELINQGLDEITAAQLTEIYLESSNIANYISLFR
ncbi:MAG: hypothetical protein KAJ44_02820 [Thermoplasmatales archaeon]|nr:hypothetical protein [Thermoplasmatales archaeon]